MEYRSVATKKGDLGETDSFGKGRIPKDHIAIHLLGELDLLQAQLGVAGSFLKESTYENLREEIGSFIFDTQSNFFALNGDIGSLKKLNEEHGKGFFDDSVLDKIDMMLQKFESKLPPLTNFVYPLGDPLACNLHLARAICRKAESLLFEFSKQYAIPKNALAYLNRLSDLLFILARYVNAEIGFDENKWIRTEK